MAMTTKLAAEKWGISDRRVRTLCANGQIDGAWRDGKLWFVPDNAPKPTDGRIRGKETLLAQIERKKTLLDGRRPLTELISGFLRKEKAEVRVVFIRKYYFFDSIRDIAKRYGFTEDKVKSMLYHTRKKLKDYLIKEGVVI